MSEWHLMFIFIVVLGLLLIWQSRRIDRLEKTVKHLEKMQAAALQFHVAAGFILEDLVKRTRGHL